MESLKTHRLQRGLSMDRLAAQAKVKRTTLVRIESGQRSYPITMHKVATALGVEITAITEFYTQIHPDSHPV